MVVCVMDFKKYEDIKLIFTSRRRINGSKEVETMKICATMSSIVHYLMTLRSYTSFIKDELLAIHDLLV